MFEFRNILVKEFTRFIGAFVKVTRDTSRKRGTSVHPARVHCDVDIFWPLHRESHAHLNWNPNQQTKMCRQQKESVLREGRLKIFKKWIEFSKTPSPLILQLKLQLLYKYYLSSHVALQVTIKTNRKNHGGHFWNNRNKSPNEVPPREATKEKHKRKMTTGRYF